MTMQVLQTRATEREAYVARGRTALARLLPDGVFDSHTWETKSLATTSSGNVQRLWFTTYGSTTTPLPAEYAEVVKAWIILSGGTPSRMHQRLFAARWLWRGIQQRLGRDADSTFTWSDLRLVDLQAAEQAMLAAQLAPRTVNKSATTFGDLARAVGNERIAPPIPFTPSTPRQGDSNNHRVDNIEAAPEGTLSAVAVDALADIFHRASTPQDVFFSSLMAIGVGSGLRWNEIATLPYDPLESEEVMVRDVTGQRTSRTITYLTYHKSKSKRAGGAGRKNTERIALTDQQALLVRSAVERLQACCAEARTVAASLERMGPAWVWPFQVRPSVLSAEDIVEVLGGGRDNANAVLRQIGVPTSNPVEKGRLPPRQVSVERFEQYMTERQDWDALWVLKPSGGKPGQRASRSLLCTRVNEGHARKPVLPLIQPVTLSMLDKWLAGKEGIPSVFERMGQRRGETYREPDETPVRVTSHMCRRFFVTAGLRSGASTVDITRWQGREHIGDLAAYDMRSMVERVAAVRDAIREGRLRGQVAQVYVQLADDVRDEWLESQVQAMHVTPLGLCIHDFTATPCPKALNCLKDCKDYLFDPTDGAKKQHLVQLQRRTTEVLERMAPEIEAGRIASGWIEEHRATLRGIDAVLALPQAEHNGHVRVFPKSTSRHQPFQGDN